MGGRVTGEPHPERGVDAISIGGEIIHEAGTVRMSDDPKQGPLNRWCQAHDVKNLFVADAAPFLGNPDKNVTLTDRGAGLADGGVPGGGNEERQCLKQMHVSRRELLRNLGISAALATSGAGLVTLEAAQQVHNAVAEEKSAYQGRVHAKASTRMSFRRCSGLADLDHPGRRSLAGRAGSRARPSGSITWPATARSWPRSSPAASAGWITTCSGGMARTFVDAKPDEQTALLDVIAFRKNETPEMAAGIRLLWLGPQSGFGRLLHQPDRASRIWVTWGTRR